MNTHQQLKDIAEIKMGYLIRGRLEESSDGVRLIQLRDFARDGSIEYSSAQLANLNSNELARFEARGGDILLSNRGENPRATLLANPPTRTLISSHFFILRPTISSLRADYLAWYLNQNLAQGYFRKNVVGTSLKMLNKQALEHLPVQIPSQEIQEKLAKLFELQHRHKKLTNALNDKMDALLSQISSQILSEKNL